MKVLQDTVGSHVLLSDHSLAWVYSNLAVHERSRELTRAGLMVYLAVNFQDWSRTARECSIEPWNLTANAALPISSGANQ